MSTYVLHHTANERRRVLLQKLGGEEKRRQAIDIFYQKQIDDPRLMQFFSGVDVEIIKWHQFNLMSIAFTAVPASFDMGHLLLTRHSRLFDRGLCQDHFDMVAHHFTATLQEMGVDPALSKEALEVVLPLRDIFAQGAQEARDRRTLATRKRHLTWVAVTVAAAAVVVQLVKKRRSS